MFKPYQKCVRQKPIGYEVIRLANFFKSKIFGKKTRKLSALLVPILITNLVLQAVVPLPQIFSVPETSAITALPECIMELTKTDSKDPVEPGETFSYHLTLKNIGTADCTGGGVKLKEEYDPQTIFVSASPVPTQANNLWNFGVVSPGEIHEVDVNVRASNTAEDNDILTNRACFWTREYDRWVCVEETTTVTLPPPPPGCENPVTLDFDTDGNLNNILRGQIINDEYGNNGIAISAVNNNSAHPQMAITFDSANPTGGVNGDQIIDIDLGTPNKMYGGPGDSESGDGSAPSNNVALGNILIIPDNSVDTSPADGLIDDPNDEPGGGTFKLKFNRPYAFISVQYIDLDWSTGLVKGYSDDSGSTEVFSVNVPKGSGNSVQAIAGDEITAIRYLKISGGDSYGIDNITLCPIITPPVCDNGVVEAGEDCDNSDQNGVACTPAYGSTCSYCSDSCANVTLTGPLCNDGVKNGTEACDGTDGVTAGQTCSDECEIIEAPACGDEIKQENEACDDGNLINFDGCNAHCQIENFSCDEPIILDFETDGQDNPLVSGQRLESSYSGLGVLIVADNLTPGHPDLAVVFDSAHPSGGTDSLDHGTPNEFYGGPGVGAGGAPSNNTALYNHLIIPKYDTDANHDGRIDNPTEDGAGIIYFNFTHPVKPEQVTLIDIDHNPGQHQIKYLNNTTELLNQPIATFGDNNIQYVNLDNTKEVTSLKFTLQDSFGIDDLVFCTTTPRTFCNDSVVQNPNSDGLAELCDAGPANGTVCTALYNQTCTYCSNTCQPLVITGPKCQDGVKNGEEACDGTDGVTAGHTCSDQCTLLDIPPSCGNGQVETGETCDNSTQNGVACTPAYNSTCTYCSALCATVTLTGPKCGDGVKNGEEQCDDGNIVAGDGCSATCTTETPPPPVCTSNCGGGGGGGGGGGFTLMGPRLLISKTKDVINVCSGAPVTYTVKITNIGNQIGKDLKLSDTLPAGWTYATTTNNTFNYSFGDITSYQTIEYSYVAHIPATEPAGTYRNTAVATISNGGSPNNTAQASVDVKVLGVCESSAYPVLTIKKSASQTMANPEGTFNYTITVENTGTDTAYNVDINDILPAGFTAVNGLLNWNVGDMAPGAAKTVNFQVKVSKEIAEGTYTNIAKARASNHNEVTATADIAVRPGIILGTEFEELPNTGPGLTMLIYFMANILALTLGIILFRKTKKPVAYGI